MTQKFEMSMMGELKYFLGFQVKQLQEGTIISQTKYIQDILTKFGFCSPLRWRPDAATWPTARDISQWAEPDIRPLGRAASAFIADKARRLSVPLAGDVPPQHLMSPVVGDLFSNAMS
jgi:hypothetical protein